MQKYAFKRSLTSYLTSYDVDDVVYRKAFELNARDSTAAE